MALRHAASSVCRPKDHAAVQVSCRLAAPASTVAVCSSFLMVPVPRQQQVLALTAHRHRHQQRCHATDPDKQAQSWSVLPSRFNPAYAAIIGVYAALLVLKNPYIFAALSIATIIPQNSTTTSLNSLVILFYESGLFMNFAEAVYCVRLVTWLSILCCLASFSVY